MSIKTLAIMAPKLCKAKDAERFAKIAELVYDYEVKHKGSVFAKTASDEKKTANRIAPVFAWKAAWFKGGKKRYIMDLITYAMEVHYNAEHGGKKDLDKMKKSLTNREKLYPDVKAIQPVASVRSAWI